jgi:hypothetical protein
MSCITRELQHTLRRHGPEAILCLDYAGTTGLLSKEFPLRL